MIHWLFLCYIIKNPSDILDHCICLVAIWSFDKFFPRPRPCSSGVAILPCSQGDPEIPKMDRRRWTKLEWPSNASNILWDQLGSSWNPVVLWKFVVYVELLRFLCKSPGFQSKNTNKNNAARRNMTMYPAIWQVVISDVDLLPGTLFLW